MPKVTVTDREGLEHVLEGETNTSVMQAIRSAGIDDLLALCGGNLSCATCHVYVDEAFAKRVGGPGPEESDLLDSSDRRTAASRLSCQIQFTDDLDGLAVTVAPGD